MAILGGADSLSILVPTLASLSLAPQRGADVHKVAKRGETRRVGGFGVSKLVTFRCPPVRTEGLLHGQANFPV